MIRLVLLVLAWTAACTDQTPTKTPSQPSGSVSMVEVDSPEEKVIYSTAAQVTPVEDELLRTLISEIPEASALVHDQRLTDALSELAKHSPRDGNLDYATIEFFLQRHGIVEPSPQLNIIWGHVDEPQRLAQELVPTITEILKQRQFNRVGIGTHLRTAEGLGIVIIGLHETHLTMKPVPRRLDTTQDVLVTGDALDGFRYPKVFVTRESGSVDQVYQGKGTAFAVPFSCKGRRGKQQVEVTAVNNQGTSVLANFAVWCNEAPPNRFVTKVTSTVEAPTTEFEAESNMLALMNIERQKLRLPPLKRLNELDRVAKLHSLEMRDRKVVAHVSPATGSASDRVKRAGIKTPLVLENVAKAYSVREAHEGIMNSPGHRANVISNEATHVGIGIVYGDKSGDQYEQYVTQKFIRKTPKLNVSQAWRTLESELAARWRVRAFPKLSSIATKHAQALASGSSRQAAGTQTQQELRQARMFGGITSMVIVTASLKDVAKELTANKPSAKRFGFGLAQGHHKEIGANAIYLVLLLER